MTIRLPLLAVCGVMFALSGSAQPSTSVPAAGVVERIQVHGRTLEGNLEGDSPDRDVMVYLPRSYKASSNRRYPVVYLLHGFTDDTDHWWGVVPHFVSVPKSMQTALEGGGVKEMILVMPNAFTRYQGSMYANSATTGNWEDFVASELVTEIDRRFRTIADVASRGLAGHSMGGYGALRIGMKHPQVFSSLYVMSACCLMPPAGGVDAERGRKLEAVREPGEVAKLDFFSKAMFASAAAWSPNPAKPPLYLDLPTADGKPRPEVLAKWAANAPLAMIDQYVANLRRVTAIAIDVGTKDRLAPGSQALRDVLSAYKIPHTYEEYEGDHINRVAERLETKVFRFFSENLSFDAPTGRGLKPASRPRRQPPAPNSQLPN